MHPCLSIAELVRHIASYHDEKTHAPQLNFGLTCRAFYEPAMDALWEALEDDIEPLLRLLPEHVLSQHERYGLMIGQAPQGDEWFRFQHHAKRISSILIKRRSFKVYHVQVLHKLCKTYPGPYPLPGLRSFQCGDHVDLGAGWGKLLPPAVQDVLISSNCHMNPTAFFNVMLERPSLRRLGYSSHPDFFENMMESFDNEDDGTHRAYEDYNMDDDEDGDEDDDEDNNMDYDEPKPVNWTAAESGLNAVLLRHDQLTVIDLDALIPTSVQILASLPMLEFLRFVMDSNYSYDSFVGHHAGRIPFPALHDLDLRVPSESPDAVVGFLGAIRRSPVKSVFIIFGLGEWSFGDEAPPVVPAEATEDGPPRYITQVTAALAQIPSVRHIIMDTDDKCARLPEFRFAADSLRALLPLRGLQRLCLSTYPVSLKADALALIPAAWPDIACLELGQHYGYDYTNTRAAGLLPFAACRRLQKFALNLDPEVSLEVLAKRSPSTQSVSPLETLSIGEAHIDNPARLAALLSGVFPNVRLVGYEENLELAEVNRLIPLFVEADKAAVSSSSGHNSAPHAIEDLLSGQSKV
ncbi:hypothetical protein PsYK624_013570 [Phanerochaete sordida]|uniref:F-box domain-containing protein n=1 Tax=Phanerochaete sordida TaxID=48140 RepID=A0A9P3FY04_9APHY|nr:hypothetical protein PsYK624_013570 [Phanerochaete sordida]